MADMTRTRRTAVRLTGGTLLLFGLFLTSRDSYLLFHTLTEMFTVVVASGVFVIAWNARHNLQNNYLLVVGVSSIFVALVDLLHALAYDGMGVFAGDGADLATQLWLAGRWIQAIALATAPFFLGRRIRIAAVAGGFAILTAVLLLSIFDWRIFPTAYVEGAGLTTFKRMSEYATSLVLLGATALLWWKRGAFDATVLRLLTTSLVLTAASELTFSFYFSVYGRTNLVGHFLRLLAFYVLYKAVIETGLVRPQGILLRDLRSSQEQLRDYAATLERRNQELFRSEQQLRERAVELQQRNQELDAYAHTVAHDLKNPLAIILTNARMVTETSALPPGRTETLLDRITITAEKMNRIIEGLLSLAQVRRAQAPAEVLDMAGIVAHARDGLCEMIAASGARISQPDVWPLALGYAPWIEEVWANYLSNALRYGGHPPEIEIGADPAPDGAVRFWVRDHGPGVPDDLRPRLFIPFSQFGKDSRRGAGHGLGLSIVLQIVEKLGGQVGMEAAPGGGSLFYFTLPAVPTPQPTVTARS